MHLVKNRTPLLFIIFDIENKSLEKYSDFIPGLNDWDATIINSTFTLSV